MRRIERVRDRWSSLTTFSRRLFVAVLAFALASCGAAYAFFTGGFGNASGNPAAGSMQAVTISAIAGGDAPSSKLYPGGPAADVILRVNNPNSFSVKLSSISAIAAITPDGSHGGCTTTGVTFTPPANPNVTVPAGNSVVHVSAAATMSTASVNACQGATFTIPVSATFRTT